MSQRLGHVGNRGQHEKCGYFHDLVVDLVVHVQQHLQLPLSRKDIDDLLSATNSHQPRQPYISRLEFIRDK